MNIFLLFFFFATCTHRLLCRSTEGSTRRTRTKLSSPPRETGWRFFVPAASWAPGRGTRRRWRGPDPGGSGWPSGRRAASRRHCWAPRWWWTSFLRLWMLTSSPRMNAWSRPLTHRSSSSSGPLVWAFGTLGLDEREENGGAFSSQSREETLLQDDRSVKL